MSPLWQALDLPPVAETASSAAMVLATGVLMHLWAYLAAFLTDDPQKIAGFRFMPFRKSKAFHDFLEGPIRESMRWFALRIIRPLGSVAICGGALFLCLAATEALTS